MSRQTLRIATDEDAVRLWAVVKRARLFDTFAEYERFRTRAPWRLQVTEDGSEAALLERWRERLDVLAIRRLWCAEGRIPDMIGQLASRAVTQGFGRLLSPLVSTRVAHRYEEAGMSVHTEMVVVHGRGGHEPERTPPGLTIRPATPGDLAALAELDAVCFDEFWRFDADGLARHFSQDRLTVADEDGAIIGYTLATALPDNPTLGRLAVDPATRRRGVGTALLTEALAYLGRVCRGPVSLCTQQENTASRRLYAKAGMRELDARVVFLVRDTEEE